MPYRRRRRRRIEGAVVLRVVAILARVVLVVLVSVGIGYAFYSALQWVAAEAERRGPGAASGAPSAAFAGEERWTTVAAI